MNLVIVESPTKAKTLSGILDKNYKIEASMGHIRDLPKSGLGVNVENNYEPEYEVPQKSKKVLRELKKSSKEAEKVILATDPDREGEAIAWHLYELLKSGRKKDDTNFSRVVFHELTNEAVQEAFEHRGEVNMNLVDAQQARRVVDRLVGYKLSPLLWKKVRYGLSAGRVQSVAVRLIVEREREREAFNPEEYWSIKADFTDTAGKRKFNAELTKIKGQKIDINKGGDADNICNELNNDSFVIEQIKRSERKKQPYPPLTTSGLQQTMANTFGFTAKRTMSAAQKLFEKGFITYHRTDSLSISPKFINDVRSMVKKEFGDQYLPSHPIFYKTRSKSAQEAHEAIRPTSISRFPGGKLTGDETKTYLMIWKRSVECQMKPAVYDQTTITVISAKEYEFKATGSIIKFDGWLSVAEHLGINNGNDVLLKLPNYKDNENVLLKDVETNQHFTQPPPRYSDATLIKQMEELGVGRPSTYAPTISTILARKYVEREGKYFKPTDVAYVVIDLLSAHFTNIVDYQFTAEMEERLDKIAVGEEEWVPVVRDFYEPFEKTLEIKEKELQKADVTTLKETEEKCPDCGKFLVVKLGKYGKFLSCSGYPECEYARPMEEDKIFDDEGNEISEFGDCPNCEGGKFVLKRGKFGKFLACSNYPKCKTTKPFLEKIGMECPKCEKDGREKGEIIIKKAKGRQFFGCSNYPDCDWSSWTDPRRKSGNKNIEAESEEIDIE